MDEGLPHQLPIPDISTLTSFNISSTSMNVPSQESCIDPEFDWIGFFSESNRYSEPKPLSPLSTNVSIPLRNEAAAAAAANEAKRKGKSSRGKKAMPARIAFHTKSADDILDDGYRWRKYGQKSVKNSVHPRRYYRCTHLTCNVKKQIQRLAKDPSIVVTTYEGIHNHPCEKLMETLSPLLKQLQFLSRI